MSKKDDKNKKKVKYSNFLKCDFEQYENVHRNDPEIKTLADLVMGSNVYETDYNKIDYDKYMKDAKREMIEKEKQILKNHNKFHQNEKDKQMTLEELGIEDYYDEDDYECYENESIDEMVYDDKSIGNKPKQIFLFGFEDYKKKHMPYRSSNKYVREFDDEYAYTVLLDRFIEETEKAKEEIKTEENVICYIVNKTGRPESLAEKIYKEGNTNVKFISKKSYKKMKELYDISPNMSLANDRLRRAKEEAEEEKILWKKLWKPYYLKKENPKKYKKKYGKSINGKEHLTKKEKMLLEFFKTKGKKDRKRKMSYMTKNEKLLYKKELELKKSKKNIKSISDWVYSYELQDEFNMLKEVLEPKIKNGYSINPNKRLRKNSLSKADTRYIESREELYDAAASFVTEKLLEDPFNPDLFKSENVVTEYNDYMREQEKAWQKANKKKHMKRVAKIEKQHKKKKNKKSFEDYEYDDELDVLCDSREEAQYRSKHEKGRFFFKTKKKDMKKLEKTQRKNAEAILEHQEEMIKKFGTDYNPPSVIKDGTLELDLTPESIIDYITAHKECGVNPFKEDKYVEKLKRKGKLNSDNYDDVQYIDKDYYKNKKSKKKKKKQYKEIKEEKLDDIIIKKPKGEKPITNLSKGIISFNELMESGINSEEEFKKFMKNF